jgi:hypothetical protein
MLPYTPLAPDPVSVTMPFGDIAGSRRLRETNAPVGLRIAVKQRRALERHYPDAR